MNTAYEDALGSHGKSILTHIALFDDAGNEISGGTYARQPVTWTDPGTGSGGADDPGEIRITTNLVFDIPAGNTVAEWRAFTALTGGTDYGGASLTNETFASDGQYTLEAANTSIEHNAL